MWLTRLALRYPISTFLIAITILVLGIVSFTQLPVDLTSQHHDSRREYYHVLFRSGADGHGAIGNRIHRTRCQFR